jgi:HCOMODA/2-hydroxy-3-carboxy-muconic semialdehyde decarboxylase
LREHGSVAVGRSVREAVYGAICTEQNARLQAQAMLLGQTKYLTDGEARMMNAFAKPDVRRPWDLWSRRVS